MTGNNSGSRLFRRFALISLAAAIVIPLVACFGLRFVVRSFVLSEAEEDAIHISAALRDCEMQRFIQLRPDGDATLTIPQKDIPQLDRQLRAFLAPFDIVKIKVFDTNTRIIYSTDRKIIGRIDPDNTRLRMALSGAATSKHESKDAVWDLADEERADVEIVETYVPVRGPGGKVVGSLNVYTDVTRHVAMIGRVLLQATIVVSATVFVVFAALVLIMRRATQRLNAGTAALRKSEEKFRTLVGNQPGTVYRCACDDDWTMEYLSNTIYDMCGYPASDFIDNSVRSYASIIHPDDVQLVDDAVQEGVRKKQPYVIEYRVLDVDGNERWCYEKGRGVFDDDGELRWLDGAIFDITARKQAEDAVRASEAQMRSVLETAPDAILNVDRNGKIVFINRNYPEIKAEDAVGTSVYDHVLPEHREALRNAIEQVFRTGEPTSFELAVVPGGIGAPQWHISRIGPVTSGGEVTSVTIVSSDITERRQAEEDLRLFRTLVDQSDDAIFTIELETGRFIDVNKKACVNLGYTREELLTMHVEEIEATIPDQFSWHEHMRQVRRQGMLIIESRHVRRDGTLFPVEVSTKYVRDKSKDYLVAVARDITERKRAEEERHRLETRIREAERMESLGVMAGGIAHDFNNLLTGVLGNVELALADLPEEADIRESLEEIRTCATRAAELTSQMLAYSGKGLFVAETVNVNSLVRHMMHDLRAVVPGGTVLNIDLAAGDLVISGGPAQIRQVVKALVTNAAEAIGDEGGTITITTAAAHIGPENPAGGHPYGSAPEGKYAAIEVADTGAGMDEEMLARAFDPFFTTKFTGRGLGLSAAQGIVHGHKGAISIESEPGKGTIVRVLLPLLPRPVSSENSIPPQENP